MNMLETQAQFESLWFNTDSKKEFIVYYTASWCKPCAKIAVQAVAAAALEYGIEFCKCDETTNEYTSGYAGVRRFPTFVYYTPKKEHNRLQSNDTSTIIQWIDTTKPVVSEFLSRAQLQQK